MIAHFDSLIYTTEIILQTLIYTKKLERLLFYSIYDRSKIKSNNHSMQWFGLIWIYFTLFITCLLSFYYKNYSILNDMMY